MIFEKRTERIVLAFFFIIALCIPLFLEANSFFVGKTTTILILSVFVMSLDFLVGRVGLVTLGHALFYGLGGYLFVLLTPEYEAVNFWVLRHLHYGHQCPGRIGCWCCGFAYLRDLLHYDHIGHIADGLLLLL